MIVVHGETLWSPAPQPMDDDDVTLNLEIIYYIVFINKTLTLDFKNTRSASLNVTCLKG